MCIFQLVKIFSSNVFIKITHNVRQTGGEMLKSDDSLAKAIRQFWVLRRHHKTPEKWAITQQYINHRMKTVFTIELYDWMCGAQHTTLCIKIEWSSAWLMVNKQPNRFGLQPIVQTICRDANKPKQGNWMSECVKQSEHKLSRRWHAHVISELNWCNNGQFAWTSTNHQYALSLLSVCLCILF